MNKSDNNKSLKNSYFLITFIHYLYFAYFYAEVMLQLWSKYWLEKAQLHTELSSGKVSYKVAKLLHKKKL